MIDTTQLAVLAQIGLAMLLGGIIGLDREVAGKPAGLRTHMLVAGAAALLVELGMALMAVAIAETRGGAITPDPIRIVQAIIIGIGFVGAGTIVRDPESQQVQGLTTAASLLVCAGVGVAVAVHRLTLAVGTALLTIGVLRVMAWVEARINSRAD